MRDRLAEVIGTLSISKQEPTQEDIDAMTNQIGDAIESAIGNGVSVLDWITAFGNMDDQIGSGVFRFSESNLTAAAGPIPFSRRWRNEGDWELYGRIEATPIRRVDSPCCQALRRRVQDLENTIATQEKRIHALEIESHVQAAASKRTIRNVKASERSVGGNGDGRPTT